MTKKLLAALLAFVMMISALPAQGLVTAAASDAAAGTPALSDAAIVSGSSISTPPPCKECSRKVKIPENTTFSDSSCF